MDGNLWVKLNEIKMYLTGNEWGMFSPQNNNFIWTCTELTYTYAVCIYVHTFFLRGTGIPAPDLSHWCKLPQNSQEHSVMIWNLTQNVCFLEFPGKMWRFNVMPNNLRRGRAAFKHFPCVRLLKWHSFAGCWHLSRAYCKHMELHDMSIHDLNTRYSLMQRKTDTSGSVKAMWKEWGKKKNRWYSNQEFVTLRLRHCW